MASGHPRIGFFRNLMRTHARALVTDTNITESFYQVYDYLTRSVPDSVRVVTYSLIFVAVVLFIYLLLFWL